MMRASDFRAAARAALNGNWILAVGTTFLASLLGASVTPFLSHGSKALSDIGAVTALIAVAVSAVTGYVSLKFLIKILGGGRFWLFGLYCLAAGAISIAVAL